LFQITCLDDREKTWGIKDRVKVKVAKVDHSLARTHLLYFHCFGTVFWYLTWIFVSIAAAIQRQARRVFILFFFQSCFWQLDIKLKYSHTYIHVCLRLPGLKNESSFSGTFLLFIESSIRPILGLRNYPHCWEKVPMNAKWM